MKSLLAEETLSISRETCQDQVGFIQVYKAFLMEVFDA